MPTDVQSARIPVRRNVRMNVFLVAPELAMGRAETSAYILAI